MTNNAQSLIDQIESRIDYFQFYTPHVKSLSKKSDEQAVGLCPFHKDKNPSFSINIRTGQYKCFACQKEGNVFTFLKEYNNLTKQQALKHLCDYLGIPFESKKKINPKTAVELHEALLKNSEAIEFLKDKRGILLETIKQFQLGIYKGRIAIPIYDRDGDLVNIRLYRPKSKENKMISWSKEYGAARLFPVKNLAGKEIILTEGEMDCIVANQMGFNAITVTSGAGTWKPQDWNRYFEGKKVYICYDIDSAGISGAQRVANFLHDITKEIYIIYLPLKEPANADITNYFIDQGYTADDFNALLESAVRFTKEEKTKRPSEYLKIHLSQASLAEYHNRNIEVDVQISGKDLSPYLIPRKVKLFCSGAMGDACRACALASSGGSKIIEYEYDSEEILKLIQISSNELNIILKRKALVNTRCSKAEIDVLESMNIEEIRVIPVLDFSAEEEPYVVRTAYYCGHGIKTNRNYTLRGLTLPDPRTQHATHLITEAKEALNTIDSFHNTPEIHEKLKIFQEEDYSKIIRDLEHITGIYSRPDLHFAVDVAFHSVIGFKFQGRYLKRGWIDCLIIGDTRTGKTQTVQSIINHYKAGEFGNGENSSFAGLVGGLSQNAKRWSLQWGKIPLNDRRLYVIDEASGLSYDDIALMSGIRSEGIAEITKIQTEKTFSRTRLIWISNPRKNIGINQFGYGVLAVKNLIGKPEDISRFDFVISCANSDVDSEVYNRYYEHDGNLTYDSELCHNLVMWAWSRKPDQVIFEKEAVDAILMYAQMQGKKYYSGIPIVEAADQRNKLARISAAIAARFYSTDDGENLTVKKRHAEMAYNFLERIYSSKSFRYDYWSEQQIKKDTLRDPEKIQKIITGEMAEFLLDFEQIKLSDIRSVMDDAKEAGQLVRMLVYNRALARVGSSYYRKTEAFINLLRKIIDNDIDNGKTYNENEIPF